MICCDRCFKDEEIKSVIASYRKRGNCPLCGSRDAFIYDSDRDRNATLRVMFETVTDAYVPYDPARDKDVPRAEVLPLACHLKRDTSIFKVDKSLVAEFLRTIIPDKAYLQGKVYPRHIKGLGHNLSILGGRSWNEFVDLLKHYARFGAIAYLNKGMLEIALNDCERYLAPGQIFFRSRVLDGPTEAVAEQIVAPPADKGCDGRVNPRGIRMLYVADSLKTSLVECRARIMDEALLAKFRVKRKLRIADLERLSLLSPWNASNDFSYYLQNIPLLRDVAKSFGSALNNYDNKLDYLGTQFICEYIRLNGWDGVAYGSTLSKGGTNIAIFNPDDAEVVEDSIQKICITSVSLRWEKVSREHERFKNKC